MDQTNPNNSNLSSPSNFPLNNTNDSSSTNSNLIDQQVSVNEMMSKLTPTTSLQQDHHQQHINPSTSDIGKTKAQTSEDLPSSSAFDEQEHNQQPINTSTSNIGETMPHNSNFPSPSSSSSVPYVQVPRPPLSFQRRQLMNMAQSAYSRKQDAFVMPELPPLLQGCPPIPEFNIPKDSMERILANVVLPPMPPSLSRSDSQMKSLFSEQANPRMVVAPSNLPRSILSYSRPPTSSLKICSDSRNIKKPPLPPYTYLRPRKQQPLRASPDDKLFKIPPLPSSWRAHDHDMAASSGEDGRDDILGDTMAREDLGSLSIEEETDSSAESSMSIDDNNDDEGKTSTSTNNTDENEY